MIALLRAPARAWAFADQLGLISSVGLAALCGVYGLAFDVRPSLLATCSAVCLFWSLFLADRLVETDPDSGHAAAFAQRNRALTGACLLLALAIQLLICMFHPSWLLPIVGALACSSATASASESCSWRSASSACSSGGASSCTPSAGADVWPLVAAPPRANWERLLPSQARRRSSPGKSSAAEQKPPRSTSN